MGKTIIISSHILPELGELCNVVGIIERGQLLFSGTVEQAMAKARVGHVVQIQVVDRTTDAAALLAKVRGVSKVAVSENGDGTIAVTMDAGAKFDVSDIPSFLVNHGFRIMRFSEEAVNLETAFMRLTKGMVG